MSWRSPDAGTVTDDLIPGAGKLVDPRYGIVRGLVREPVRPSEPFIHRFIAHRCSHTVFSDGDALKDAEGGCAFDEDDAINAAIGEAVERYCGSVYSDEDLLEASYDELDRPAVSPEQVVNFSQEQREQADLDDLLAGAGDTIRWGVCQDPAGRDVLVPAQLIYVSYDMSDEPFIRRPISTGMAAGQDLEAARLGGMLESIERDAFMIHYLTRSRLPHIERAGLDPEVRDRIEYVEGHGLELVLLDARTDIGVPTVIALLLDDRYQPHVSVAAAADITVDDAVLGALEEVLQTRSLQVTLVAEEKLEEYETDTITTMQEREAYWSRPDRMDDLGFWTEDRTHRDPATIDAETADGYEDVIDAVQQAGLEVCFADLTTPDVADLGLHVSNAVIPGLQPLYLSERYRYWGGDRLRAVPDRCGYASDQTINQVPHPFP